MSSRHTRGFSLIEALVALVVMGFGMLGVLGIQSALRQYSDISKQRSEAVRLAQEKTEAWRAFVKLDADGTVTDYADIATHGPITVTTADSPLAAVTNTTFTYERTVGTLANTADMPQFGRWLQTTLRWNDRTGAEQRVDFHTHITGVSPDLAGTLLTSDVGGNSGGGLLRRPLGRHPSIPRTAVDNGDGTSTFAPPGGTSWIFGNASGEITRICNPTCSDFVGFLLSGFVRFTSTDAASPPPLYVAPTIADAEDPITSPLLFGTSVGVEVAQTAPFSRTVVCASELRFALPPAAPTPVAIAYWCPMEVTTSVRKWSGKSVVVGLAISSDAGDADSAKARVCRYTTQTTEPPTATLKNSEHPSSYSLVDESLANQNFLVIRGGDGSTAFSCPASPPPPAVPSAFNTFAHQPTP